MRESQYKPSLTSYVVPSFSLIILVLFLTLPSAFAQVGTTVSPLNTSTIPNTPPSNHSPVRGDVEITTPYNNQVFNTTSISMGGFYLSISDPPTITLTVDGTPYTPTVSVTSSSTVNGTFGYWSFLGGQQQPCYPNCAEPVPPMLNGWHILDVHMQDQYGNYSTSVQFETLTVNETAPVTHYPIINILYSNSCKIALAQHSASCPTLDKLIPYDNSSHQWSGNFVNTTNGWVRVIPPYKNSYQFYTNKTVCVECFIDENAENQMQNIFIEPTGFQHTTQSYNTVITNQTVYENIGGVPTPFNQTISTTESTASFIWYHDRYVSDDCNIADIVYSPFLLNDTINYLWSNCSVTHFNKTSTMTGIVSPFDVKDSPAMKMQWWEEKQASLDNHDCVRKTCNNIASPISNFNSSWETTSHLTVKNTTSSNNTITPSTSNAQIQKIQQNPTNPQSLQPPPVSQNNFNGIWSPAYHKPKTYNIS